MPNFASWLMLIASAAILFPARAAFPQKAGARRGYLLVVNKADHTLGIVDPQAGKEIATVTLTGFTGHEVAVSRDGRRAYVPIYGDSGVGMPGTDGGTIDVIDIASRRVVRKIDLPRPLRPHCAIVAPNGLLYVTAELADAIEVIDPRTHKIVGKVPTEQPESHMLAITSDGKLGYTANVGAGTVTALDLAGRRAIAVIPIAKTVQRISISEDNQLAFTSDQTKPRLAVIGTKTNKIKNWVTLPGIGFGSRPTLDGRWLLVTIPKLDEIAVIDLHTMQVARTVKVPASPQEILMQPDGTTAYISCDRSHQVAALNLGNWQVEKLIGVGRNDDGLGWAPAHK